MQADAGGDGDEEGERPWWQRPPRVWPPVIEDPNLVCGDVIAAYATGYATLNVLTTGREGAWESEGAAMASAWIVAAAVTKVKVFKEVDLEEGSLPLDRASAGSAASKASAAPTLSPVQSETSEVARVSEDWEASQKAREAAGERSSAPPPPSPPSHAAKEEGSPKANPRKVRVMAPAPDSRV